MTLTLRPPTDPGPVPQCGVDYPRAHREWVWSKASHLSTRDHDELHRLVVDYEQALIERQSWSEHPPKTPVEHQTRAHVQDGVMRSRKRLLDGLDTLTLAVGTR